VQAARAGRFRPEELPAERARAGSHLLDIGDTPSWGTLLRQGSENIVNHPHLTSTPVAAFAGTLPCVVLIGEALREAFDPKKFARLR